MSTAPDLPEGVLPAELDEHALEAVHGGTRQYTGGRFQLEVGSYSVGYLRETSTSAGAQGTNEVVPPGR